MRHIQILILAVPFIIIFTEITVQTMQSKLYYNVQMNDKGGSSSATNDFNLNYPPQNNSSAHDMVNVMLPSVLIGVFIKQPTPFLEEFFNKIFALDYPKNQINIFIYNRAEYHSKLVSQFVNVFSTLYASFMIIHPEDNVEEQDARNLAVENAVDKNVEYFFSVDAEAHLDNPRTLSSLINLNKDIIAPMLVRPFSLRSNFWGALSTEGYYARSNNYKEIVKNKIIGIWDVPFINGAYLVSRDIFMNKTLAPNYINHYLIPEVAFCLNNRKAKIRMFVSNTIKYGHLVKSDNFETHHFHNDLFQIFDNPFDWESKYLHPNFTDALDPNRTLLEMMKDPQIMPCPDVFWLPMVTPAYCKELIEEMENFGNWFNGSNYDYRADGGAHEAAPTVDIHMNQIGMEDHWLEFLRLYVEPLQSKFYMSGLSSPPIAKMNFVVRYKPDEQAELAPHHDKSTYTVNIALNTPKKDFEGGGCRFTRYNCSVVDTKLGWMLLHPGKLTHEHEGLRIRKGTRYVLVSFVDPDCFMQID